MEIFKNFRRSRGMASLRKRKARLKRTRFRENISHARTMGIVWDASNPAEFQPLSQFHQKMAERNIDVRILGYYPGKELPDKLTAIIYLNCLKKDDVNFIYRPVSREAVDFINTPFDILIDVNFRKVFPLIYVSSLSLAGFKVGLFDPVSQDSPFDLMMSLDATTDISTYLKEVVNYLEMINTNNK